MQRVILARAFTLGQARASLRHNTTTSFTAGLFKRQMIKQELFPYPHHTLAGDEKENFDTLVSAINESNGKPTVTAATTWQDAGVWGSAIPADFGGLALSHTACAAVAETMGELGFTDAAQQYHHSCCCALMIRHGSSDLKGQYLTGISSGSMTIVLAPGELSHEFDISSNTAQAVFNADTSEYTLDGKKIMIGVPSSVKPTHAIVLAKTETQTQSAEGKVVMAMRNTPFIISLTAPGVTVEGATIVLKGVQTKDVVGAVGEGFNTLMACKHTMRYAMDAALLGSCKAVYNRLVAVSKQQGGATLEPFLTSLAASLYAVESALYALVANLDIPAPDSLIDSALVTVLAQRVAFQVIHTARQCATDVIPDMQTLLLLSSIETLLHASEPAAGLQDLAACCGIEDFGVAFSAESTLTTMSGRISRTLGAREKLPIAVTWPEVKDLEVEAARFGDAVEAVFVTHAGRSKEKHLLLGRISQAAALLYGGCAAVSRASSVKGQTALTEKLLCKTLLPSFSREARILLNDCLQGSKVADDSFVRLVGEMVTMHVPIAPDSPELEAEVKAVAEQITKEKKDKEAVPPATNEPVEGKESVKSGGTIETTKEGSTSSTTKVE